MRAAFELNHETLAADPNFAPLARELEAFAPIDSSASFNRYCRAACEIWRTKFPSGSAGDTPEFDRLLNQIENGGANIIRTGWGGVVVTLHEHPKVEKFLIVRQGAYLALEKHEQKDERLEVREGAGLILWRRPNEQSLTAQVLRPNERFHFSPGQEHCVIGCENLLVFESSTDPKGIDQDLIFIYQPD